jgi:hypothetical protein
MHRKLVGLMFVVLWFAGSGSLLWGQANQIQNPEFDDGTNNWGRYGTAGYTWSVVQGAKLSGPNAALMDVTDASVTSIGIAQGSLKFEKGQAYPVGVTAKADKPREMVILIQLYKPEGPNWIDIVLERVSLTTEPKTFLFEYTHSDDSMADHPAWQATLYLMLKGQWWAMAGDTVPSKVWVDRVHVGEQPPRADVRVRTAQMPQPADGARDVPRDVALTWMSGEFAAAHDLYLGQTLADVNTASRDDPGPVEVSQGQTATAYTPAAPLAYDQTYYWRVDEVNQPADNTIFKGGVWSFTVEPYAYPIAPASATASSAQAGMGPEKTIDDSGLTGDLHGVEPTTMWLSAGAGPHWIQYEFDQVYKLHEMQVWNSNQLIEAFMGFGAKTVTMETSLDGVTWTPVADVPQFSRAPGAPGYAANTTVALGGAEAKYVKLTITANWAGLTPQTGLAEVRFFHVPVQARNPQPADGATDVSLETAMDWRPGREATSHQVYFGPDRDAVAGGTVAAQTEADHGYTPDPLNLDTTYYWRVDEVGATTYAGDVWSFTTEPFKVVDAFENYTSEPGAEVFSTWMDGFDNPAQNGSVVGLATAVGGTFCDTTIFHAGQASMPFAYDNTAAPLSEAVRTFDTPQDWTARGIKSLSLWFRGTAGNGGQLYVKINGTKLLYDGDAADLKHATWLVWNIDLSQAGNVSKVTSLTIGVEGATAKGSLHIDDIRLYPETPEFLLPVQPAATGLAARYTFDGDYRDSAGSHHGTAAGAAKIISDTVRGQVVLLNGTSDKVDVPYSANLNPQTFTVGLWVYADPTGSDYRSPLTSRDDAPQRGYILYLEPGNTWQFWTGTGSGWSNLAGPAAALGEWTHVGATFADNQKTLYLNGRLVAQGTGALSLNTQRPLRIGAGASESTAGNYFFKGMIDEVRLYNRVLSAEEMAGLAGLTKPVAQPF